MGEHTDPEFVRELHSTLLHLYDPAELRQGLLINLFTTAKNLNPTQALQQILLAAIEELKPGTRVPSQNNAWRIYHILNQRYASQFPIKVIADNLALSHRQLRRLQTVALQALAEHLWEKYNLKQRYTPPQEPVLPLEPELPASTPTGIEQDLELLRSGWSEISTATDVAEVIRNTLSIAKPLIEASAIHLDCAVNDDLPKLVAPLPVLRHALINILTALISVSEGGTIHISTETDYERVWINVIQTNIRQRNAAYSGNKYTEKLEMAQQLVELCGGCLEYPPTDTTDHFSVRITLTSTGIVKVLVVDDNEDAIHLLKRFLTNTRYHLVWAKDPNGAIEAITENCPQIIVLDLMLPGVDGWELLARLREHPKLDLVPIIIYSILPEEDLALALGAAAFIQKPVSREIFIKVLDQFQV
jgi:CheY-like chemotaxis protein